MTAAALIYATRRALVLSERAKGPTQRIQERAEAQAALDNSYLLAMAFLLYWTGDFRIDSRGVCAREGQSDQWRCIAFTRMP